MSWLLKKDHSNTNYDHVLINEFNKTDLNSFTLVITKATVHSDNVQIFSK